MTLSKMVYLYLLSIGIFMAGCSNDDSESTSSDSGTNSPQNAASANASDGAEHAGHGVGPNGGVVFDLGRYHAEFTVDHESEKCMILVLGSNESTPTPVESQELTVLTKETKTADGTPIPPMTVKLLPENEQDGKATTFVGTNPGFANVTDFQGTVLGMIDGKPSQGEFNEADGSVGHSHSHGEDDALVWEGEPRLHEGMEIKLGHHGKHLHAGEQVEPAVSITRNGAAVTDAKVFNSLIGTDGTTVLDEEVATVFEPATADEPAHYAQGALSIPASADAAMLRFRIVPANGDEVTFDVSIQVEK